ncbi:hypothetical protein [Candidatus Reidiella endopervernicosa]|uniref:PAC domain-containing protein n=1 Tax=Candidatus Reidiella endopervernicosa TaxID=2738883 RepID=A0A6N0HU43_9GAMM|nr:hypothetical protein [Candidatus Reidiella endopervernicosa]QKQ25840.1 hypothetical protein HUE57_05755 [Candidatus Reidiella endopervernicosa]
MTRSGERIQIRWNNSTVVDENDAVRYIISTGTDITEIHDIGRALEQSEERLRQITDNIDEVFWMMSPELSEVIYVSPAYEQVWQRSCESLLQNASDWIESVHVDDVGWVRNFTITTGGMGSLI